MGFHLTVEWGSFFLLAYLLALKTSRWIGFFVLILIIYHFWPRYTKETLFAGWSVAVGAIWLLAFVHIVNTRKAEGAVLNTLCIIALINAAYVILQTISHNKGFPGVGLMANTNETACLLALCSPAFIRKGWIWCLPLVFCSMVLTGGLGGLITFASAMIVVAWQYNPWSSKWLLVPVAAVAGYICFDYLTGNLAQSAAVRWVTMKTAVIAWWNSPNLLGWGLGTWKVLFARAPKTGTMWMTAHNEYMQLLVEAPLALIALGGYFASIFIRTMRTTYRRGLLVPLAGLTAAVVSCMFHFTMHIATTALVALVWVGMMEVRLDGIPYKV